jgi:DNA-binding CsgD family transcriptional regulator
VTSPPGGAGLDWQSLARSLLELCEQPAALLDQAGQIRAANRNLEKLLDVGPGGLTGRPFHELALSEASAIEARSFVQEALYGAPRNFELRLLTSTCRSLILVLKPQLLGDASHAGLLLRVVDWRPAPQAGLPPFAAGEHYELSSRYEDFGVLLSVWSWRARDAHDDSVGQRCYLALHGLDVPCQGCPAFSQQVGPATIGPVVIPRDLNKLRLDVVEARVISGTSIAVSTWQVGGSLLGQLVNGKVALMAERQGLTARERNVLELLVLGRSNDEIASNLEVTERTVKYHKRNVLQKLGAESKHDLMRLIL